MNQSVITASRAKRWGGQGFRVGRINVNKNKSSLDKQTNLIVSQAFFLGKPMLDEAFCFILQATPPIS